MQSKRLKLVACEIFYREICAAVARSPHRVDIEFLPKGLHDIGAKKMSSQLQESLDKIEESNYDAVLLGYALCNNGVVGLRARTIPVILPRAHDCITLFLGNKERYLQLFNDNPGVYYETTGWLERGNWDHSNPQWSTAAAQFGLNQTIEEMVEKYGEENAHYLLEQLGCLTHHYSKCIFIEMGIEPDDRFERSARELAAQRGWDFEKIAGDMGLIQRLVNGPWNEDEFLTVPPGYRIAARFDEQIVTVEKVPS